MKEKRGPEKGKAGAGVLGRDPKQYIHLKKLNVRIQQRQNRILVYSTYESEKPCARYNFISYLSITKIQYQFVCYECF